MRVLRAQLRPADTNAATLYQVGTLVAGAHAADPVGEGVVRVCNTSGANATCRLFHHRRGTTYDQTTAQLWDRQVPADQTREFPIASMRDQGESLGVRSSVADALTFTLETE